MIQLEKYQDDTISSINDFYKACDILTDSHYLNAVNNIVNVLKCIVASKRLYQLFGKICNGFDLAMQINQLRVEDETGASYLVVPSDPTRTAAFVFRLLMEIDTKDRLDEFLKTNYMRLNYWNNFDAFAKNIIPAFKTATMYLLNNPDKINVVVDTIEVEEEEFVSQESTNSEHLSIPRDMSKVEDVIMKIMFALQQMPNFDKDIYNNLSLQVEDLIIAYKTENKEMIEYKKSNFLSFTRQVGVSHLFDDLVGELDMLQRA